MKKISDKQKIEKAKRRLLKWVLFQEQEGKCKKCGKVMTYYNKLSDNYPHLSHKTPLSAGGKTHRDNCSVLCSQCHGKIHGQRNIYGENPSWSE